MISSSVTVSRADNWARQGEITGTVEATYRYALTPRWLIDGTLGHAGGGNVRIGRRSRRGSRGDVIFGGTCGVPNTESSALKISLIGANAPKRT